MGRTDEKSRWEQDEASSELSQVKWKLNMDVPSIWHFDLTDAASHVPQVSNAPNQFGFPTIRLLFTIVTTQRRRAITLRRDHWLVHCSATSNARSNSRPTGTEVHSNRKLHTGGATMWSINETQSSNRPTKLSIESSGRGASLRWPWISPVGVMESKIDSHRSDGVWRRMRTQVEIEMFITSLIDNSVRVAKRRSFDIMKGILWMSQSMRCRRRRAGTRAWSSNSPRFPYISSPRNSRWGAGCWINMLARDSRSDFHPPGISTLKVRILWMLAVKISDIFLPSPILKITCWSSFPTSMRTGSDRFSSSTRSGIGSFLKFIIRLQSSGYESATFLHLWHTWEVAIVVLRGSSILLLVGVAFNKKMKPKISFGILKMCGVSSGARLDPSCGVDETPSSNLESHIMAAVSTTSEFLA